MILTVTANAAVDKTLTVANLQLGRRHRAQQGLVMPGGKGINVARALRRLDEPVIATGLAGGVSTVVFAGSLPRRMETSFYADVTREMNRRKVSTVIDTDGEPLRLALAAEPADRKSTR